MGYRIRTSATYNAFVPGSINETMSERERERDLNLSITLIGKLPSHYDSISLSLKRLDSVHLLYF